MYLIFNINISEFLKIKFFFEWTVGKTLHQVASSFVELIKDVIKYFISYILQLFFICTIKIMIQKNNLKLSIAFMYSLSIFLCVCCQNTWMSNFAPVSYFDNVCQCNGSYNRTIIYNNISQFLTIDAPSFMKNNLSIEFHQPFP